MTDLTAVSARLALLGYTVAAGDSAEIEYYIESATARCKDAFNRDVLPTETDRFVTDMAAGLFLSEKKASGRLTGFDFAAPVKSVTEGDTRVDYALSDGKTPESAFDALIASLTTLRASDIAKWRMLSW